MAPPAGKDWHLIQPRVSAGNKCFTLRISSRGLHLGKAGRHPNKGVQESKGIKVWLPGVRDRAKALFTSVNRLQEREKWVCAQASLGQPHLCQKTDQQVTFGS